MTITDPSAFGSQPSGQDDPSVPSLVEGVNEDFSSVTDAVAGIAEIPVERTNRAWIICFAISVSCSGCSGC